VSESATIRDRDNVSGPRELADPVHHHAGKRLPDLFWASLLTGWETPLRYVTRQDAASRNVCPESNQTPSWVVVVTCLASHIPVGNYWTRF
jgi:hypothetical protein